MSDHLQALAHQIACGGAPYCSPVNNIHSAVCHVREREIAMALRSVVRDCAEEIGKCFIGRPPMDNREMGPLGHLRKMFQDALFKRYGLETADAR